MRSIHSVTSSSWQPSPRPPAMSASSSPMPSSTRSRALAAVCRRSGGHTSTLTSRPTATPIAVSRSRATSRTSFSKPVVSTTSPVVAMVVASAPSHGTAPSTRATTSSSVIAPVVSPKRLPHDRGEQHRDDGRGDLLHALGERAVDGGVHHEQGRPRREERLRQVQHARRDDPRGDGGEHRLGELEDVVPPDRVTEPVVDAFPPSRPHARPHAVLLSLTDRHYGRREEGQVGTTPMGGPRRAPT